MAEIPQSLLPNEQSLAAEAADLSRLRTIMAAGTAGLTALTLAALPSPKHESMATESAVPQVLSSVRNYETKHLAIVAAPAANTELSSSNSTLSHSMSNSFMNKESMNSFESLTVPKAVAKDLRHNTVLLTGPMCSGRAIRDEKTGQVIGASTADHCLPQYYITGSDGKNYMVIQTPILAQTGKKLNKMKTVAAIDRFIVPNNANFKSADGAIGVAKGQNAATVYKTYMRSKVGVNTLKVGEVVYAGIWPQYQPENFDGILERQLVAMKVIDPAGKVTTNDGKTLDVVWTSMSADRQGARCSWGASGAEMVVEQKTKKGNKLFGAGELSVFYDLTGSVPAVTTVPRVDSNYIPQNVNNSIVALCGFSYRPMPSGEGGTLVHVVQSQSEIPGYVSPEQAFAEARVDFKNPNYPKTIVNGIIGITSPRARGGYDWYNNPVLFHFPVVDATVMGVADPFDPDHLAFSYIGDNQLSSANVVVYPHLGSQSVDLLTSSGPDQYQPDPTGQSSGDFIDGLNQTFGSVINYTPNKGDRQYSLKFSKGNYSVVPGMNTMK